MKILSNAAVVKYVNLQSLNRVLGSSTGACMEFGAHQCPSEFMGWYSAEHMVASFGVLVEPCKGAPRLQALGHAGTIFGVILSVQLAQHSLQLVAVTQAFGRGSSQPYLEIARMEFGTCMHVLEQ